MALDAYATLGVQPNATDDEIKAAWRRKAQQLHPDRHPDDPFAATRFQLAKEAFEILSDPARRARYDCGGGAGPDDLPQRARGLLAHVAMELLKQVEEQDAFDHSDLNLIANLRRTLSDMRVQAEKKRAKSARAIKGFERTLKRFKRKDGGENLIADLIAEKIAKAKAERDQAAAASDEVVAAVKMLDDYEDIASAVTEVFVDATTLLAGPFSLRGTGSTFTAT